MSTEDVAFSVVSMPGQLGNCTRCRMRVSDTATEALQLLLAKVEESGVLAVAQTRWDATKLCALHAVDHVKNKQWIFPSSCGKDVAVSVGGGLAAVVVLIILIQVLLSCVALVCRCCCCRKRDQGKKTKADASGKSTHDNNKSASSVNSSHSSSSASGTPPRTDSDDETSPRSTPFSQKGVSEQTKAKAPIPTIAVPASKSTGGVALAVTPPTPVAPDDKPMSTFTSTSNHTGSSNRSGLAAEKRGKRRVRPSPLSQGASQPTENKRRERRGATAMTYGGVVIGDSSSGSGSGIDSGSGSGWASSSDEHSLLSLNMPGHTLSLTNPPMVFPVYNSPAQSEVPSLATYRPVGTPRADPADNVNKALLPTSPPNRHLSPLAAGASDDVAYGTLASHGALLGARRESGSSVRFSGGGDGAVARRRRYSVSSRVSRRSARARSVVLSGEDTELDKNLRRAGSEAHTVIHYSFARSEAGEVDLKSVMEVDLASDDDNGAGANMNGSSASTVLNGSGASNAVGSAAAVNPRACLPVKAPAPKRVDTAHAPAVPLRDDSCLLKPAPKHVRGVALFDFKATREDELSLKAGVRVDIIAERGDGWVVVEEFSSGTRGLVPAVYVGDATRKYARPDYEVVTSAPPSKEGLMASARGQPFIRTRPAPNSQEGVHTFNLALRVDVCERAGTDYGRVRHKLQRNEWGEVEMITRSVRMCKPRILRATIAGQPHLNEFGRKLKWGRPPLMFRECLGVYLCVGHELNEKKLISLVLKRHTTMPNQEMEVIAAWSPELDKKLFRDGPSKKGERTHVLAVFDFEVSPCDAFLRFVVPFTFKVYEHHSAYKPPEKLIIPGEAEAYARIVHTLPDVDCTRYTLTTSDTAVESIYEVYELETCARDAPED